MGRFLCSFRALKSDQGQRYRCGGQKCISEVVYCPQAAESLLYVRLAEKKERAGKKEPRESSVSKSREDEMGVLQKGRSERPEEKQVGAE